MFLVVGAVFLCLGYQRVFLSVRGALSACSSVCAPVPQSTSCSTPHSSPSSGRLLLLVAWYYVEGMGVLCCPGPA